MTPIDATTISAIDTTGTPDIRVNGIQITEKAILEEMQYHPADNQRQAMIEAAESLVISELLKQRCQQLNLIDANSENTQIDEEKLIESLIQSEIYVPEVSDEECERYYESNLEKFCTSPILEVDHILLAADKEDIEQRIEMKEQAENLLEQLKQSPHLFSDFAMRFSLCPSKEQGGSLGQISKGQTVPEFESQLFLSEEGLVEKPIESRYGFHIANIHRKIEGKQLPYPQVEAKINQYLSEKVRRKAVAQYVELLIADANIEGFEFEVSDSPLVQ